MEWRWVETDEIDWIVICVPEAGKLGWSWERTG